MRGSKRPSLLVLASLVAAGVVAMPAAGQSRAAPLAPEGVEWRLLEAEGARVSSPAEEGQPGLMLDAEEGKATGFAGCNHFFSTYRLQGESLAFGPVASTRRACPEGEDVEARFLDALARTSGWRISSGELLLLAGDEVVARFVPKLEGESGTGWETLTVRSVALDGAEVTLVDGVYEGPPAAPGAASRATVTLTDARAFGSMNGSDVAAVVLATSLGGSGTFSELALLRREGDSWINIDTVNLGDRVAVHSIEVLNDSVTVSMATHGPGDPMCCPTLDVTRRFTLDEGRLTAEGEADRKEPQALTHGVWHWVTTMYSDDTTIAPERPGDYTLRFLDNGQVEVKADCNLKSGSYAVDSRGLSITVLRSTMAACAPGSLEEEFVRGLSAARSFVFYDGDLVLALKFDSGTMRFTPGAE